ncbi:MAG: carboxypeptidase-like regulatory domain-containing protein [bacterium]
MKKLVAVFTIITLVLTASWLFAQQVTISGSVIDAKTTEPLVYANVSVQGEAAGAATDADGEFSFMYSLVDEITLVVTYMGYESEELVLQPGDNTEDLLFELKPDVFQGETVVVTGVASKRSRSRSEVAVARVDAGDLSESQSYKDVSSLLGGKVAGVQVKKASGNVGGGIRFDMRANPGLNGDGQPLVVIDGVIMESGSVYGWDVGGQDNSMLADLNPDDIQNIEVLKGPAATASYGTNGSNGVVIVTTKRGKGAGGGVKPFSLNYKTVFGYNRQSYEYSEDEFVTYDDCNAIFRDGPIQQHILSVSGGSGNMRYYVGLDKRDEKGIIPNNYFDRTAVRANIDVFPSEKITLNASASYAMSETGRPNNDNNIYGFLGNTMLLPVSYLFTDSVAVRNLRTDMKRNRFIGSVQVNYSPIKNLNFNATLGIDDHDLRDDKLYPYGYYYSFPGDTGQRMLWDRNSMQMNGNYSASYTYYPMEDLEITSSVGGTFIETKTRTFNIQKKDFETGLITNIGAASTYIGGDETKSHRRTASLLTTHQFSFLDQYFATVVLRNEYASSIGAEAPQIFYPSATFAVRLDKYDFFPKLFNMMKLRAGYGESGQLPGTRDAIPLLWQAERSGLGTGAVLSFIGNEEIEPERIKELEIGFDAEFLDNYAIEFTYFNQKAENSIIGMNLAPSTGRIASSVPFNVGEAKGWGMEALLRGRPISTRNFMVDFTINHSYQENEVVDIGDAQPLYSAFDVNVYKPGLPKYAFYVYKVHGALFDEDGAYAGVDADGPGDEKTYAGNPVPPHTGSFSFDMRFFRKLNIRVLCDWALEQSMYNNTYAFQSLMGNNAERNELAEKLGELTPGTDEYRETAHAYAKTDGNYDWNVIERSDYFKLREISLSYDLSSAIPKLFGSSLVSNLVVGVSGSNLWTTTKYSGADPEVNMFGSAGLDRSNDFLTLQHPTTYNVWLRIGL